MNLLKNESQSILFDLSEISEIGKPESQCADISDFDLSRFSAYNLCDYKRDVADKGLRQTWREISRFALTQNVENQFLSVDNFAELYEIGLALQDKFQKKKSGQYYTPDDVAVVMASWLNRLEGENVCDVACGTGKLILTYLDVIGRDEAVNLIKGGRLYLYDLDDVALDVCKTIIMIKYGKELGDYIRALHCDFLSKDVLLPANCKVISNPPYATVDNIPLDWQETAVATGAKELYAMFMEKIIKQSAASVIITPYSFIGGNKFFALRKIMNDCNGFIVSFDNVPGNIFCGRKRGIFNTNTSNSVRAAITVVENILDCNGFRLTPLIRFKNAERKNLLKTGVLEAFLGYEYQVVTKGNPMYCKCTKELYGVWKSWNDKSKKRLGDYTSQYGGNVLSMPSACRYYTSAAKGLMNRKGQIILNIADKDVFNYIYCLINSSFAYWYWRLFDGGITYPKGLLLNMPVFYDLLTADDVLFFNETAKEMIDAVPKYAVTKNNVGVQENIKYPRRFRDKINRKMLDILGVGKEENIFDLVHSNMALEISV